MTSMVTKDVFGGQLGNTPNHDSVMWFIFMSGYMNKQNIYVETPSSHNGDTVTHRKMQCVVFCQQVLFSDTVIADHYLHVLQ
jgi:hypothetical protein